MRRLFQFDTLVGIGLWIVSIALAGFLIELGGRVVADLPRVERDIEVADFVEPAALNAAERTRDGGRDAIALLRDEIDTARLVLDAREQDTRAERDTLAAWVASREAVGDEGFDAELVARTERLEAIRRAQREARGVVEALEARRVALAAEVSAAETTIAELFADADESYDRALFARELRVFGLRLALTLPLLGVALWAVRTKRQGATWPLWRGFVLFAAFAFFVELVPYLPSYGGYVRSVVGVALTVVAGLWIIRAARAHAERRAEAAARSEAERRTAIDRGEAVRKVDAGACPSCDHALRTVDGAPTNHCVHCGLRLYGACGTCGTRRLVFHPFCMVCGTDEPPLGDVARATAEPQPA